MIKAVIFDYFGVISSDEYWNMVKTDKSVTSDFLNIANRVNLGKLHWKDFVQTIAEKTGQTFEQVESMYANEKINPQILALAQELKNRYKTAILTNAHHEFLEPILKKTGIGDLFDATIISSRVGVIKPDSKIFQITLKTLGVGPQEAVFIDDITRNVVGAEEAGLYAIHYRDMGSLKIALSKLLGGKTKS